MNSTQSLAFVWLTSSYALSLQYCAALGNSHRSSRRVRQHVEKNSDCIRQLPGSKLPESGGRSWWFMQCVGHVIDVTAGSAGVSRGLGVRQSKGDLPIEETN